MTRHLIELPECGILVGNAIYNTCAGYLGGCGWAYTNWSSDSTGPYELVDCTVAENQGNLVQFWWGDGGSRPQTKSRWLALEDLNIAIPPPDFKNLKNISLGEFDVFQQYGTERAGAGVLKTLEHCRDVGLYSTMIYCSGDNRFYSKQYESVKNYIGYDFGERFTFRQDSLDAERSTTDLKVIADDFCARVAAHIQERKAAGFGNICCTSSNFYMDYEVVAGVDFTMFEDCTNELNIASALSRGLCREFGLQLWGSHIANEHYCWLPFANPHRFETLRSQMCMKYLAGAKVIISESGAWHCQTTADNSPQNFTPRILKPLGPTPIRDYAALVPEAEKCFPSLNKDSEYCRSYRRIMSDFYDFVKANGTPTGQPAVTLAVAKGNFDLCTLSLNGYDPCNVIGGMQAVADKNPSWFEGMPERGWQTVSKVFFPNPQGIFGSPDYNRMFTGTPFGQIDIVSFAYDTPTADFLSANYRALLFSGWNTCSEKQYAVLTEYVKRGGRLFISIPHFSTDTTRNFCAYTASDLVRGGDLSELCGVKVKGPGPRYYWGTAPAYTPNCLGVDISRRYGVFRGMLGDLEIVDPNMETLLFDHESTIPLLLRRKLGKGEVFFLNSWYYPGSFANEYGPLSVPGDAGMIGDIFKYIAKLTRLEVYISGTHSDDPDAECAYICYSYFPESETTCLFNIDFEKPHTFTLHRFGKTETVTLEAQEIRLFKKS